MRDLNGPLNQKVKLLFVVLMVSNFSACAEKETRLDGNVSTFKSEANKYKNSVASINGYLYDVPMFGLYESKDDALSYNLDKFVRIYALSEEVITLSCLDEYVTVEASIIRDEKNDELVLGRGITVEDSSGNVCFSE